MTGDHDRQFPAIDFSARGLNPRHPALLGQNVDHLAILNNVNAARISAPSLAPGNGVEDGVAGIF